MRTLFLGSYGFGNLGDELCLIDAVRKFSPSEAWAHSFSPEFTRRNTNVLNFISDRDEIPALRPERIVLGGGGVGFWPSLRDALHWMRDGVLHRDDVELHIYNIGVGLITAREWSTDEVVRSVLRRLASFSVRDHISRWLAIEWNFGLDPSISYYPEQTLPPEAFPMPALRKRALLGKRKLVGFSITARPDMIEALHINRDRIHRFVSDLGNFGAVPIVSTMHGVDPTEWDSEGFNIFAHLFLKKKHIFFKEMIDPLWWKEEMTALRLKYAISKLDLLVSQRKHNIIHAIGCGVPVIGIFPDEDDSVLRIFFSLRHKLPAGSRLFPLATGRFP